MKTIYLIIVLCFVSCKSANHTQQVNKKYHFYFDNEDEHQRMKKYYSWRDGPLNYLYKVKNDNIVFSPIKGGNNVKRKYLSLQDTTKLDIKDIKWLNNFNNIQRDSIFLGEPNNTYYIIEKDTFNGKLYVTKVFYIEETE